MFLTFDWRAISTFQGSSTTNAQVELLDPNGNVIFPPASNTGLGALVEGGLYDTGWNKFSLDLSCFVQGQTSVTVILYLHDYWDADWDEENLYDSITVRTCSG